MGLGTDHLIIDDYDGSQASNSVFLPELWSDEIIATFKKNLVLANLVTNMNHSGKKGQLIHIPTPARSAASAKANTAQVTFKNPTASDTTVSINKHYEYSFLEEDILRVQALPTLRQFLVDDAGYALATQIDQDLFALSDDLNGGSSDDTRIGAAVQANDGITVFDADNEATLSTMALTDLGIRRMIQSLDDNDVPQENRALIVPPVEKKNLLGIARYTEQAFVGDGGSIRTGMIGNIYSVPVYVSTNCPWIICESSGKDAVGIFSNTVPGADAAYVDIYGRTVNWSGSAATNRFRQGLLIHKSAWALVTQLAIRTQTQYKQEYLADLFTADTIYGVGELRDNAGVAFITAA